MLKDIFGNIKTLTNGHQRVKVLLHKGYELKAGKINEYYQFILGELKAFVDGRIAFANLFFFICFPGSTPTTNKMPEKQSFSEDQVAEFQEVFLLFDTRGDGMIQVGKHEFLADFPSLSLYWRIFHPSLSLADIFPAFPFWMLPAKLDFNFHKTGQCIISACQNPYWRFKIQNIVLKSMPPLPPHSTVPILPYRCLIVRLIDCKWKSLCRNVFLKLRGKESVIRPH